jgi:hypothetical protein
MLSGEMQSINQKLTEDKFELLRNKVNESELSNKNKELTNKLSIEDQKLSAKEKSLIEEQNKIKIIEKMSTKEKEDLKTLVKTIEAKELRESKEIKELNTEAFKLKNDNKMV